MTDPYVAVVTGGLIFSTFFLSLQVRILIKRVEALENR